MAFVDMYSELHGAVPKVPYDYCRTLIKRAWKDICRNNLWSFQLFEDRWITPEVITAGTVTVTQGSTAVTLDATAAAAVLAAAYVPTLITKRQFRVGVSGIYNIWAWDGGTGLTLDKVYAESSGSGQSYSILQCYYPAPMQDFLTFLPAGGVRDFLRWRILNTTRTRGDLDRSDLRRVWSGMATDVVYYDLDRNPNSSTYNWPMFEIWAHPRINQAFQLYGIRRGADLDSDTDVLPPAVGEDCVLSLAKKYAYEWAESNKGDTPRMAGSDYRFLMGAAHAEYSRLLKDYRRQDRETVDLWFDRLGLPGSEMTPWYSSITGRAYPGAYLGA